LIAYIPFLAGLLLDPKHLEIVVSTSRENPSGSKSGPGFAQDKSE